MEREAQQRFHPSMNRNNGIAGLGLQQATAQVESPLDSAHDRLSRRISDVSGRVERLYERLEKSVLSVAPSPYGPTDASPVPPPPPCSTIVRELNGYSDRLEFIEAVLDNILNRLEV